MPYSQKVFPERLGNGHYTIAQAGCFLVADCNLLQRFGKGITPPTLNAYFLNHGVYLRDSDGANEDLAWGSVTHYDSNIVVDAIGGTTHPNSNNAIVKFHYNSVHSGQPIDHFCLVDHVEPGTGHVYIVDSWDGLVKSPAMYQGVYHLHTAWASYKHKTPSPVVPSHPIAPKPKVEIIPPKPASPIVTPAGALSVPTVVQKYYVKKTILGFAAYTKAASREDAISTVTQGNYYIFKESEGMLNISKTSGISGYWINPADNIAEVIQSTPDNSLTDVGNKWKSTYSSLLENRSPIKYVFLKDYTIVEYGGQRPAIPAKKYSEINIYGSFIKDNTMYYRPKLQADTLFQYYFGIPLTNENGEDIIEPYDEIYDPNATTATRVVTKTITFQDRIIMFGETISKWFDKLTKKHKE